jgi:hypothetical protein
LCISQYKIGCLNTLITISLFEAFETSGQALTKNLQDFLEQCSLVINFFVYVKDEDAI